MTSWSRYEGVTRADGSIAVVWETNDDDERGVGTYARDEYVLRDRAQFDRVCGKSRQGVGQTVTVTLDGEEI